MAQQDNHFDSPLLDLERVCLRPHVLCNNYDEQPLLKFRKLLTEGMGVRAAGRVVDVHRDTVLKVLKFAGERCEKLLASKLVDVPVKHLQCDEIWTYVFKKSPEGIDPERDNLWDGDYYTFLGMDSETKLLFAPIIGKRSTVKTETFAKGMAKATTGRLQITTDGFRPYKRAIRSAFGNRADFAQFYKERNMYSKSTVHNPALKDSGHIHVIRSGSPLIERITTAHVERLNLTLRLMTKRFNRKTVCFSKSEEYLNYAVFLFVAFYDFCKPHSTLGKGITPAMEAKLTSHAWTVKELVGNGCGMVK